MRIRRFEDADLAAVIAVFRDAIMNIASKDYDADQLRVWLQSVEANHRFRATLKEGYTYVAEDDGGIVAFGQLHPLDHVHLLYCRARGRGKGYAARLLAALQSEAYDRGVRRLYTEASLSARGFFERHGFAVIEAEVVERMGVKLPRFRMQQDLADGWPRAAQPVASDR